MAVVRNATGNIADARAMLESVLKESSDINYAQGIASAAHSLSEIYAMIGRIDEAEELIDISIEQEIGRPEPNYRHLVARLSNMFSMKIRRNDYDGAKAFLNKALEISQSLLGKDHPETATVLANVGYTHLLDGDPESALPIFQSALQIHELHFGVSHPEIARDLLYIAEYYRSIRDLKQADAYIQRSLNILEHLPQTDLKRRNEALVNLFEVYLEDNRYAEALAVGDRAISAASSVQLSDAGYVAGTLKSLSRNANNEDGWKIAAKLYEISIDRLGPITVGNAMGYINIASALWSALRPSGGHRYARGALWEALKISTVYFALEWNVLSTTHYNLALCLHEIGELDEAERLYRGTFSILERAGVPGDPSLALRFNTFGNLLRSQRKTQEAEENYWRAWSILEKWPKFPIELGVSVSLNLAEVIFEQGRANEAEPLYERTLQMVENTHLFDPDFQSFVYKKSAAFFLAVGNLDRAMELQSRFLA